MTWLPLLQQTGASRSWYVGSFFQKFTNNVLRLKINSLTTDPENQLLARGNRKRRDFESLRDSILTVSGTLDRSLGGPPVDITASKPTHRRTIYAMIDRQNLPALFRTFDLCKSRTRIRLGGTSQQYHSKHCS